MDDTQLEALLQEMDAADPADAADLADRAATALSEALGEPAETGR